MAHYSQWQKLATVLAVAVAAGHAITLIPLPSDAVQSIIAKLVAKGASLTNEQRQELERNLYQTVFWDRVWDATLAIAAGAAAGALFFRRLTVAASAALLYSIGILVYAATALEITKWGIGPVVSQQVSRLWFVMAHGNTRDTVSNLFRLFTQVLGLVGVPLSIWLLLKLAGRRQINT